jgi:cytochrome c1
MALCVRATDWGSLQATANAVGENCTGYVLMTYAEYENSLSLWGYDQELVDLGLYTLLKFFTIGLAAGLAVGIIRKIRA